MSKPKRHHYVPQMLLKRFADPDGILHVFDRWFPEKGVQKRTPRNLFVKGDLYTQFDDKGIKDVSVETEFLAGLENSAEPIVEKIFSAATKTRLPDLDSTERRKFAEFFYIMMVRGPEARGEIMKNADREVTDIIKSRPADHLRTEDEIAMLEGGDEKKRLLENASIQSMQESFDITPWIERLAKGGIAIAVNGRPNQTQSFVIGSRPITRLPSPSGLLPNYADVEVWLPLARTIAVAFIFDSEDELVVLEPKDIKVFNSRTLEQSTVIAGCSVKLIESLRQSAT